MVCIIRVCGAEWVWRQPVSHSSGMVSFQLIAGCWLSICWARRGCWLISGHQPFDCGGSITLQINPGCPHPIGRWMTLSINYGNCYEIKRSAGFLELHTRRCNQTNENAFPPFECNQERLIRRINAFFRDGFWAHPGPPPLDSHWNYDGMWWYCIENSDEWTYHRKFMHF